ncbi:MAG: flagellar type III secretion system pore protein FliP [Bacteroidales bacterium]|nr:flagellar type III secretion system pore protein FliP [Clostridium sp.]MCM1202738.1 flagellar type III secretion system pore protein FliP [Bacteroidales bacterium]
MKNKIKNHNITKWILNHIHIKKFIVAYLIIFAVLCIGFRVQATGIDDALDNERETVTNLEENVPFSLGVTVDTDNDEGTLAGTLQLLLVITVISLAPSILVMMTSFTRIIVVFHFLRTALGTQSTPPNNVLIGLALFLTLFIMSPTLERINEEGLKPISEGTVTQEEGLKACMEPLRDFMLNNAETEDVNFFLDLAKIDSVEELADIPNSVLIPAFMLGELRKSFIIGFLIYIPFIIIDMVVASTLMAMGMMMLPPTTISMPFKILLFVMADGWNLVIGELIKSFTY